MTLHCVKSVRSSYTGLYPQTDGKDADGVGPGRAWQVTLACSQPPASALAPSNVDNDPSKVDETLGAVSLAGIGAIGAVAVLVQVCGPASGR